MGPLLAIGALGALIATTVFLTGAYNVAADRPHPVGWARMLHAYFDRSVEARSRDLEPPENLDADWRLTEAAVHYGHVCAGCHGAPDVGQNVVALGLQPTPQYLVDTVADYDDRQLAWIVMHGVRYSAMPAWPAVNRLDEVWSMVAFLRALPSMDGRSFRRLAYGDADEHGQGEQNANFSFGKDTPRQALRAPYLGISEYAATTPATGFSNFAAAGDVLSMCSRCHGDGGRAVRGRGAVPNLTLLDEQYLEKALHAYANGERGSGFMQPVASQLSDSQLRAVARYYADVPAQPVDPAQSADVDIMEAGRQIAQRGVPSQDVAPCTSCHGLEEPVQRYIPRIRGQYEQYLVNQMELFARGVRGDVSAYDPMAEIAHQLQPDQIKAVAAWYSRPSS